MIELNKRPRCDIQVLFLLQYRYLELRCDRREPKRRYRDRSRRGLIKMSRWNRCYVNICAPRIEKSGDRDEVDTSVRIIAGQLQVFQNNFAAETVKAWKGDIAFDDR